MYYYLFNIISAPGSIAFIMSAILGVMLFMLWNHYDDKNAKQHSELSSVDDYDEWYLSLSDEDKLKEDRIGNVLHYLYSFLSKLRIIRY